MSTVLAGRLSPPKRTIDVECPGPASTSGDDPPPSLPFVTHWLPVHPASPVVHAAPSHPVPQDDPVHPVPQDDPVQEPPPEELPPSSPAPWPPPDDDPSAPFGPPSGDAPPLLNPAHADVRSNNPNPSPRRCTLTFEPQKRRGCTASPTRRGSETFLSPRSHPRSLPTRVRLPLGTLLGEDDVRRALQGWTNAPAGRRASTPGGGRRKSFGALGFGIALRQRQALATRRTHDGMAEQGPCDARMQWKQRVAKTAVTSVRNSVTVAPIS